MGEIVKITSIFLIVLVLIVGVVFFISTSTLEDSIARRIYKYKTEYVGDNANVGNIVMNIPFANEYFEYQSIEIKSTSEPYMLIIKEKLKEGYSLNSISARDLRAFADLVLATIKNLENVRFEVYYTKDDAEQIATYTFKRDENSKFNFEMSYDEFEEQFNKIYKVELDNDGENENEVETKALEEIKNTEEVK